jgi:hypothetical protein
MKRRLVLAVTALALVGGAAGIASAAPLSSASTQSTKAHQFCLVFYYKDGSRSYECVNW